MIFIELCFMEHKCNIRREGDNYTMTCPDNSVCVYNEIVKTIGGECLF